MSYPNNRSAPSSPGHHQTSAGANSQRGNSNNSSGVGGNNQQTTTGQQNRRASKGGGFFGNSAGGSGVGGGGFDFNQFSQNISNSLQDIFSAPLFNSDPLMDVRKMLYKSCNSCGANFSVFMRKKRCQVCMLHFCHSCMELNQRTYCCRRCLVFADLPLTKDALNTLRVRDLKWFLSSRNIPSDTYSEKRELVDLIIQNVNPPPAPPPQSTTRRSSGSSASSQQQQRQPSPQFQSQSSRATSPQSEQQPPLRPNTTTGSATNSAHSSQASSPARQTQPQCSTSSSSSFTHPNEPSHPAEVQASKTSSLNPNQKSNLNSSTFNLNDIHDETEIKDLSVRQLKLLLTRNFVDFKGCVEREELIQKTILLWNDKQISNKFKDDNEDNVAIDENVCKICMENAIDCVLLECGHMLTCTDCGKILSECPVCRQFVTRVVHVFKA